MNWLKPTIFWKLRFSFGLGRYYAKGVKVGGGLNYFFVGLVSGRKWRRNLGLGKNEWVGSIYCHIRFERNSSEWRWKWEEEKNWHWGCWVWLRVWKYELAQKWKVSASKKSPARENMTSTSNQIQPQLNKIIRNVWRSQDQTSQRELITSLPKVNTNTFSNVQMCLEQVEFKSSLAGFKHLKSAKLPWHHYMELFFFPFVFLSLFCLVDSCLFVLTSLWSNVSRVSSLKSHSLGQSSRVAVSHHQG